MLILSSTHRPAPALQPYEDLAERDRLRHASETQAFQAKLGRDGGAAAQDDDEEDEEDDEEDEE